MKKFESVTEYQGQVAAASTDFPFGAPIDSPIAGVGTPYTAATEKVHQALIQKLFAVAGVVPNGTSDTATNSQLYDVMQSVLNDFSNASNRNADLVAVAALATLGLPADDLQATLGGLQDGAVSTRQTSPSDNTPGRLLTPGAGGLLGDALVVANFDSIERTGLYAGIDAAGGPTMGSVSLLHIEHPSSLISAQIAISELTGKMYYRTGSGPWVGNDAGRVDWFATNTTPAGYLRPNGAAVSRAAYADVFARMGTTFGPGDGSTTFNIPDLRGQFLRAFDDGAGVDTGRVFGSTQAGALESHAHSVPTNSSDGTGEGWVEDSDNAGTVRTVSTGSTGGTETRPTNVALMPYIKY